MTKIFGIDVSSWQGNFDFKKAKAEGVTFAILRGAAGTNKDKKFETYYKNAKAQGLNVGVYIYSYSKNESDAKAEANYLYEKCLKGKKFELPIYFDIEDKVQKKLSKKQNTAIVKAFCSTLEAKGYWVGIYASKSFYSDYLNDGELQKYAHWVAQWAKSCTYSNKSVLGMWQFGGETNVIRTNKVAGQVCDQNYMLVDYPTMIKNAGKNGYSKNTTTTTTPEANPTPAPKVTYYKKCDNKYKSIVDALNSIKVDSSFNNRKKIAKANGMTLTLINSFSTNTRMLNLLKQGKLIKP